MAALAQIPHVQLVAIAALEKYLGIYPVPHHVGRAPFAGDDGVQSQVPPKVVGQILRTAVEFPFAQNVEAVVIDHEDAAGTIAVGSAQRARIDSLGAAMDGV